MSSGVTSLKEGARIAGRYRVKRPLGAGGMGAVYVAEQENLSRDVALKVMRVQSEEDAEAIERFEREAKAAASINHKNVVTTYDYGVDKGRLFIAMELIDGQSLSDRLKDGRIGWRESLPIVEQIAAGLTAAHERDVLHRDLKPGNVMVTSTPHGDEVKLVDFGLARSLDTESGDATLTKTGMVVGTPGYIAPEIALHGSKDPRSDLYALGVLWFEMLTGSGPFHAATPVALVMKHAQEAPPRPSEVCPEAEIPPPVENMVLQLLAKDPDERFDDADALHCAVAELAMSAREVDTPTMGSLALPSPTPRSVEMAAPGGARRVPGIAIAGVALVLLIPAAVLWQTRSTAPAPLAPPIATLPTTDPTLDVPVPPAVVEDGAEEGRPVMSPETMGHVVGLEVAPIRSFAEAMRFMHALEAALPAPKQKLIRYKKPRLELVVHLKVGDDGDHALKAASKILGSDGKPYGAAIISYH